MGKYGFDWDSDTLTPALDAIDDAADRFLTATIEFHTPQVEAAAKKNARWVDRTSNARNGLFAVAERERPRYRIVLGHGVPYGVWLEVRFAGKYAIIEETCRTQGTEVMKTVKAGFMAGLAGGT